MERISYAQSILGILTCTLEVHGFTFNVNDSDQTLLEKFASSLEGLYDRLEAMHERISRLAHCSEGREFWGPEERHCRGSLRTSLTRSFATFSRFPGIPFRYAKGCLGSRPGS